MMASSLEKREKKQSNEETERGGTFMQIHFQFSTQLLVCFLLESGGVGYQDLLLLLLLVFPHIPPCGKGREEEERREVCFPLSFFVARRKEGEGKSFESGYSEEETEEEGGGGLVFWWSFWTLEGRESPTSFYFPVFEI